MNCKWILAALLLTALAVPSQRVFAQTNPSPNGQNSVGPQKHLSTIVFAGVAGAVLGLSTLSFYGRPQEKLSHIAIGAAIGIIGGTLFTTYKAATETKDYYNFRENGPSPELWSVAGADINRKETFAINADVFKYSF